MKRPGQRLIDQRQGRKRRTRKRHDDAAGDFEERPHRENAGAGEHVYDEPAIAVVPALAREQHDDRQ